MSKTELLAMMAATITGGGRRFPDEAVRDAREILDAIGDDDDLPFDPNYTPSKKCERCGLDEFDAVESPCIAHEWRFGSMYEEIEYPRHVFNREEINAALGKAQAVEVTG